ncbi:hypothetical protein ACTPEF_25770, partial [Clostridioides difficile]
MSNIVNDLVEDYIRVTLKEKEGFLKDLEIYAEENSVPFLGMSDTEIGDRLKINRSTSFRSRKNSLEEIKKKLKENMNDE